MNRTTSGIVLSEFVLSGDPLYNVELLPVVFWGVRNNWYQSYNSTIIEIGAQKSQSGPIAWPNAQMDKIENKKMH